MLHNRSKGTARVRLAGGHEVHLGRWGTPEARERYDQVIAAWLANGRRWPPPDGFSTLTLQGLIDRYLRHCAAYYKKNGRATTTRAEVALALELLLRSDVAAEDGPAVDFGPMRLKAFRRWLLADPQVPGARWNRRTINRMGQLIVAMFRWAVSEELVPESVWTALTAVRALEKGRTVAPGLPIPRESGKVLPAARDRVDATLRRCPPAIATMAQVQESGGMRPSEVLWMRPRDLRKSEFAGGRVLVYCIPPECYKLEHRDDPAEAGRRLRYLGPRAVEVLRPWIAEALAEDPAGGAFIFSPRRELAAHFAARRAARQTPKSPSHDPELRHRARGLGRRADGARYTLSAYTRAIARACDAAFPPPDGLCDLERLAWRLEHRWSPRQLRHNRATLLANAEDLEVAGQMLGHAKLQTTMRYVELESARAVEVAVRHG